MIAVLSVAEKDEVVANYDHLENLKFSIERLSERPILFPDLRLLVQNLLLKRAAYCGAGIKLNSGTSRDSDRST